MVEIQISGIYVYRSLQNNQDIQTSFDELEFGRGTMNITQTEGIIKGTFDMGNGYNMTMEGTVYSNDTHSYLRMTAYGVKSTVTDKWLYDYFGMIVPIWPNATAQIPTIIGSVIRSADHGASKAGVTTTFYMVLKT